MFRQCHLMRPKKNPPCCAALYKWIWSHIFFFVRQWEQLLIISNRNNQRSLRTSVEMISAAGRLGDGIPKWISGIFESIFPARKIATGILISKPNAMQNVFTQRIFIFIPDSRNHGQKKKHVVNNISSNWRMLCGEELNTASVSARSQWLSSPCKCYSRHASKFVPHKLPLTAGKYRQDVGPRTLTNNKRKKKHLFWMNCI